MPQFVEPAKGAVAGQILLLGFIFIVLGICSDGLYTLLAGTIGRWFKGNLHFLRAEGYFAGSVYIGLGVVTALSGSERNKSP
ncbi:MAG: hypothetical protein L6R45_31925 [Anaerolineae bacterium]|nr:hypothetical protein [Anaerolineae bacterium]